MKDLLKWSVKRMMLHVGAVCNGITVPSDFFLQRWEIKFSRYQI